MIARLHRFALFALYQSTVAVGLLLLPFAIVMRRVGLPLPVHRLIECAERAYEARSTEE